MNWPTGVLGDHLEPIRTINPARVLADGEFVYVDLGSIDRYSKQIVAPTRMIGIDAPSRARQVLTAGDVLVSTVRPNLNAVACVGSDLDAAIGSTGFAVLRATKHLDPRYLFHWVQSPGFIDGMIRRATGASYPAVSDRIVRESPIPLPPRNEQRRIARVLDAVESLREKRRVAHAAAAELGPAIYEAMFGTDHAPSHTLDEISDIASGITKGRKAPPGDLHPVPYLAVSNVQAGHLNLGRVGLIEASRKEIDRFRLYIDDILLTEGGDPDKLGRGALWRAELGCCIHQNHVFRVRVRDRNEVEPAFLSSQLAAPRGREYFLRAAKQTTGIASINKTQLGRFPTVVPPIELQREFCHRISHTGSLLDRQLRHLEQLDALFAALQHRAFTGTL